MKFKLLIAAALVACLGQTASAQWGWPEHLGTYQMVKRDGVYHSLDKYSQNGDVFTLGREVKLPHFIPRWHPDRFIRFRWIGKTAGGPDMILNDTMIHTTVTEVADGYIYRADDSYTIQAVDLFETVDAELTSWTFMLMEIEEYKYKILTTPYGLGDD